MGRAAASLGESDYARRRSGIGIFLDIERPLAVVLVCTIPHSFNTTRREVFVVGYFAEPANARPSSAKKIMLAARHILY